MEEDDPGEGDGEAPWVGLGVPGVIEVGVLEVRWVVDHV